MRQLYVFVILVVSVAVQSALAQCPATVSIRISQVNDPTQLAFNSFCKGEQVQLNMVGTQPGLTYQWKLNGQNLPNGTSATYLANASGYYTITVQGANNCTLTSLPVSIDVNDCQPTGRARVRGVYLEDFNGDASIPGYQNPFLRLGFLTYKSDLGKFPATVQVNVYQKSNNRLITTLTLQRISTLERNLLALDAACGIESTQLYDVLYFLVAPNGDPAPFNFDPAIYNDPGGYYLVSEGICCRQPVDNVSGAGEPVVGYMELARRQQYNVNNKGSMFGTVFNLVSKVETCTGQPLSIDYFDARNPNGVIRVSNATIQPINITRTQYSLEAPLTSSTTSPFFRPVQLTPGFSATNFAGSGNSIQIDPNTGSISGTLSRPGTYAYVVKAETYNGSTRLSEIRRELQLIVKECPVTPQPKLNLSVVGIPTVPTSNTFCPGKIAQLNAIGGIPGGNYQWQRNGVTIAGVTSSTLVVDQQGTYTVSIEKPTSCPPFALSDPLTVTLVVPSVTLTLGNTSTTNCQNNTSQLIANANNPGATFQWLLNGTPLPGINTQTYSTSTAGLYTVQISQPDGCTAVSTPLSVPVAGILVAPTILTSVSAICPGGAANLSVNATPDYTYQWLRDGQPIGGATTNTFSTTQAGSYTVRVQTPANCTAVSAPARVTTFTPPSISIGGEAQICQGSSTTLTLANPNANMAGWQYRWQRDGITVGTLPIYSATTAGSYRLRITDANGCTAVSSDWLVNEVKAITVQMVPLSPVCINASGPVTLSATPAGGVFSGPGVTGSQFNPATAGVGIHRIVYTVTGSSSCLSGTATQSVEVRASPVITLPAQLTTLPGIPVMLPGPTGSGFTYSWSPPQGLSDPLVRNPLANPGQTITYQLQVRDGFGCLAEATILIELIQPIIKLYVPSAFTPNSDGNNDTWQLWGAEGFPQIDVTVFNRWGTVIFHSEGYQYPFDGFYKGERIQAGMYTYIIRYDTKEEPLRGTVMVIY